VNPLPAFNQIAQQKTGATTRRRICQFPPRDVAGNKDLGNAMSQLRMQLTASADHTMQLISRISSLRGVESVEEIADLMPHMDDSDSSSDGLTDDIGPGTHLVLVQTGNAHDVRHALDCAESCARELGIVLEVVDDELNFG